VSRSTEQQQHHFGRLAKEVAGQVQMNSFRRSVGVVGKFFVVLFSIATAFQLMKGGRASSSSSSSSGLYMASSPMEKAKSLIGAHDVMIFSKTYCPYCTRAKDAIQKLGIKAEVLELDVAADGDAVQQALLELTKQRTVPNIFIKGKHLGGCDVTLAAIASGEFQQMVKK